MPGCQSGSPRAALDWQPRRRRSVTPFVDFVEFVCVALPWHVRPHDLDQPLLAFIRQPIPQPHDQGKIRVLDVECGQDVGKGALM